MAMTLLVLSVGDGRAAAQRSAVAFPPQRPTKVLVLGDSVLAATAGLYASRLPGRSVTLDAVVGRTTSASADRLRRLGSDWDVVVVLLGYNDGGSAQVFQPAARRILDQLAAVPRVAWLSLHEVQPGYREVNRFLVAQAASRPNLHTADWNALNVRHPEALAGDGIHPRGAGPALLADLVTAQVVQAERDRSGMAPTGAKGAVARSTPASGAPVAAPASTAATAAAEAARVRAEQEAARVSTEQEAARVSAEQEAARVHAEQQAADRRRAEQEAQREAERRAQELRDVAAAAAKARADAEAALQVKANAEADRALATQRMELVEDARTVARIEARAAALARARRPRLGGTRPVVAPPTVGVRSVTQGGPQDARTSLTVLVAGALTLTGWSLRRRHAG